MIEAGTKNMSSFHLAGIVPIAGQKLDFDFPWHDCLQPINKNYLVMSPRDNLSIFVIIINKNEEIKRALGH